MNDHDDDGPWAATSLSIRSPVVPVGEIAQVMDQPTADPKADNHWCVDFKSHSGSPLTDELAEAERFVADKIHALEELAPTCEIWLFMSWTPQTGPDHVAFSRSLLQLLGIVNTDVTLDTWTGCEHCTPDDDWGMEPNTPDDERPHAVTTLRIKPSALPADEIARTMGRPTADGEAPGRWCANFEAKSRSPLTDELAEVERFVADKLDALERLAPTCQISVCSTWRPKASQDHALFSPTLVTCLGRIGADIVLDTWTGCEFCGPAPEM